jgi:hypothetical protein
MCPHCGRDAPLVYRGVVPYCTACGRLRAPLSGPSVNLAGKPSKVGGTLVNAAGILVLVCGLGLAAMIGGLLYWLFAATVALAVGGPIAAVALVLGALLLGGGRRLRRSGDQTERATFERALAALAEQRGAVTAADAARVLGVSPGDADAWLTAMAKREHEPLAVDVDENGVVWYLAPGTLPRLRVEVPGVRVDPGAPAAAPLAEEEEARPVDESAYAAPAGRVAPGVPGAPAARRR